MRDQKKLSGYLRTVLIIGKRFKLVHVRFGRHHYIEVTTIRCESTRRHRRQRAFSLTQSGQITRDNVYGDIQSDFVRRDLSINALYYNYQTGEIADYVGGYEDILHRRLRVLGDPATRFAEDPIRLLRVLRLKVKLNFTFQPATEAALRDAMSLLASASSDRLYLEVVKLFHGGYGKQMWIV